MDAARAMNGGEEAERSREVVIRVRDLVVEFGRHRVMKGLDLDVYRGEVLGFVGGSGQGKSVLTRAILGLLHKTSGRIEVFGQDRDRLERKGAASPGAALGRAVSKRRAVLGTDRQAEHSAADARELRSFAAFHG